MHRLLVVPLLAFGFLVVAPCQVPKAPSARGKPVAARPAATKPAAEKSAATAPAAGSTADPAANPAVPERPARVGSVQFDGGGWPIVAEDRPATPPLAPAGETRAPGTTPTPAPPVEAAPLPAIASGMQLGSPLLDVFQATRSPAAFEALGGLVVWWRLTIYGNQGEVIGVREVTHTADCAFATRDRLEHADGRVYGRSGASVFAERQGMPWPTLADSAASELALFGLQLRLPWCFGDGASFTVLRRDTQQVGSQTLARIVLERRPPAALDIVGPEVDPAPRDRFELLYEPSGGQPRQFVHRFANSLQTRRVLLEDWQDVEGVRMPYRRVYVDEQQRPTTMFEILRIEKAHPSERDFRLH
ncbi:MAG TPA: hypothetical protein VFZ65_13455 [Planctomycetota bacterium]|nr:hypothetical protein [Planctomycetota bacterium]